MHAEVLEVTRQVSGENRVHTSRDVAAKTERWWMGTLGRSCERGRDQVGTYAMYHDITELSGQKKRSGSSTDLEKRVAERTEQLGAPWPEKEEVQERERIEQSCGSPV